MRSHRATHNLIAVSANNRETGINVEQSLDTTMLVSMSNNITLEPRRESNVDEMNGKEEADTIYDLGRTAGAPFDFEKAQPQHFAFLFGYGLGSVTTSAAGSGYEHVIKPLAGDLDAARSLPTFTAAQRYGKTVLKRLFASLAIDQVTVTFPKDDWLKISGQAKGTGKVTNNVVEETVSELNDAATITLAANGIEGADAAARLDNVHRVKAETSPGVWEEVTVTAVSADTPAVLTITPLAGDGLSSIDYKVLYIPTESGWMTFPGRIAETPLRMSELTVNMGGKWDGSAFQGGRPLTSEISSIEHQLSNNLKVEFVPGAGGAYASRIFREGRAQTLKLNREMREYILQQHLDDNDTFGVHLLAQGDEFDVGHNYQVEFIFPKCGVLTAPISADGKVLAEAGDLLVMADDTHGSVIIKVKNLQAGYAA